MSDPDYVADVERVVEAQCDLVEMRARNAATPYAWPFTDVQLTAAGLSLSQGNAQRKVASSAVLELSVAALYKRLSGEEEAAIAKAAQDGRGEAIIGKARIGSGEDILTTLETDIKRVAKAVTDSTILKPKRKRFAIYTGRGDG
jgi:hypothetical protein